MRILHSSDWHLGVTLHQASRHKEQVRFLAWLRRTLVERAVDVLVVAGDIFDQYQPSAEAQALYYGFLADVARDGAVGSVVMVGGNHDAGSRLDAPREILGALGVHVVGGFETARESDLCCPIRVDGEVAAVVVPVPFVHEYRLGVRGLGDSIPALRAQIAQAFTDLYRRLADAAEARFPDVPLVATGHLTCAGAEADDYHTPLHHVGNVGGLPPEVFGQDRYDYVALGHIHRGYQVAGTDAWYSGTPVAVSLKEGQSQRRVLLVEVEPGHAAHVESLPVPCARRLIGLEGPLDEVRAQWRQVTWSPETELPPYGKIIVRTDEPRANPAHELATARADADDGPRLVHVEQRRLTPSAEPQVPTLEGRALSDLTPTEVFDALHRARHGTAPDEALRVAFEALLGGAP
jgi:DNA repair protein SbcD/Mre11